MREKQLSASAGEGGGSHMVSDSSAGGYRGEPVLGTRGAGNMAGVTTGAGLHYRDTPRGGCMADPDPEDDGGMSVYVGLTRDGAVTAFDGPESAVTWLRADPRTRRLFTATLGRMTELEVGLVAKARPAAPWRPETDPEA